MRMNRPSLSICFARWGRIYSWWWTITAHPLWMRLLKKHKKYRKFSIVDTRSNAHTRSSKRKTWPRILPSHRCSRNPTVDSNASIPLQYSSSNIRPNLSISITIFTNGHYYTTRHFHSTSTRNVLPDSIPRPTLCIKYYYQCPHCAIITLTKRPAKIGPNVKPHAKFPQPKYLRHPTTRNGAITNRYIYPIPKYSHHQGRLHHVPYQRNPSRRSNQPTTHRPTQPSTHTKSCLLCTPTQASTTFSHRSFIHLIILCGAQSSPTFSTFKLLTLPFYHND